MALLSRQTGYPLTGSRFYGNIFRYIGVSVSIPFDRYSVLCLFAHTSAMELLSAKIVDCFQSSCSFEGKLCSSTFFSVAPARSGQPEEPYIRCSFNSSSEVMGNGIVSDCFLSPLLSCFQFVFLLLNQGDSF